MSTLGNTTADGPSTGGSAQGASSTTEQAKEKVQETAQQAAGQARGQLSQQVDQRSTQAGEQVSSTADDVRSVAQQLREQGKEQPAKLAEQAADRAQRLGDYLKQSDGDTILRDVEDFGRRQPWAVMFGGLAVGFLASRFLKASSSRRYESSRRPAGLPAAANGGSERRGVIPPATSVPPVRTAGAPVTRDPAIGEPTPGRAAGDVSLSGGVMPPEPPSPRPGSSL
jgi:gas vesicle protein